VRILQSAPFRPRVNLTRVSIGNNLGLAMPIYEYRCGQCGHRWSETVSMAEHDRTRPTCPKCQAQAAEPVYSAFFAKTVRKS
jgi:putative FmdB family regulatory protein